MDVNSDRRKSRKETHLRKIHLQEELRAKRRLIQNILKKSATEQTDEERKVLLESHSLVEMAENRKQRVLLLKERSKEIEDEQHVIFEKCCYLAELIKNCKSMIVYTGAGISTAAKIPDYRGPNGIWTQLKTQSEITSRCDLMLAEPTFTHMAISELYRKAYIKHVISQNCDGLHIRSGLPQMSLSEIHGNMYIEVCSNCKLQYLRAFDVTEKTSLRRHKTDRKCHVCDNNVGDLIDTIVHFGEKGKLLWPLNWESAAKAAKQTDLILCLGSSLKILRKYHCLWPKKQHGQPKLAIVNLQWTPKDSQSDIKINAKCDDVMKHVTKLLNIEVPSYQRHYDPIYYFSTPLKIEEEKTCNRLKLTSIEVPKHDTDEQKGDFSYSPSWFGKGIRKKK